MIKFYSYNEKPLDLKKISNLFEESFNQKFDEEYWKWRFLRNPNSNTIYIVYAEDDEELVSYYAISPMKLEEKNGDLVKIALSNMTMTHPNYQGKGLFSTLANQLFDILKKDNFVGVYGFANSNSHYGFRKNLGWIDISILNIFKLKTERFRAFLIKNKANYSYKEKDVSDINIDKINSLNRTEQPLKVFLDSDNFLWRFIQIPNNKYKSIEIYSTNDLLGMLVFKEFKNEIDIMEFWYAQKEQKGEVLINTINFLHKKFNKDINIWSNVHSIEHLLLEKHGFLESEFNSYFGFIPLDNSNKKYVSLNDWHYRFTDSDIF